jgi:hypothetical protein
MAEADIRIFTYSLYRFFVFYVDAGPHNRKPEGPVHGACVEIPIVKPFGQHSTNGALS